MVNINEHFDTAEIYELYKVKIPMKWSWKKLIMEQNKFYLLHNPMEEEE